MGVELPVQGSRDAEILVVCDAPSEEGMRRGVPLSGKALKLFQQAASMYGFYKDDFVFVSPCPPMDDSTKASDAREGKFLKEHRDLFLEAIDGMKYRMIIPMGKTAARQVYNKSVKITKARGSAGTLQEFKCPVLPMLSPKHVVRIPEMHDTFMSDFNVLRMIFEANYDAEGFASEVADDFSYEWCTDIGFLLDKPPSSIAVDTETTGLEIFQADTKVITVQIAYSDTQAISCPVHPDYWPEMSMRKRATLIRQLRQLLENPTVKKAGHNIAYDHRMLWTLGIDTKGWAIDTQAMAFLVDENMKNKSQSECVRRWLPSMAGYSDKFDLETDKSNMLEVPRDEMLEYGCGDALSCYKLAKVLSKEAARDERQWNVYKKIILPAMLTFAVDVEPNGITVDQTALRELYTEAKTTVDALYDELIAMVPNKVKRKHADKGLAFSRDMFVRDILFSKDGFGLVPKLFTKSTRMLKPKDRVPSVSSKDHMPFFLDNPFAVKYIDWSKLNKLLTTYIGKEDLATGFWQYLKPDSKIYPSFALTRTTTGRTASSRPNCFTGDVEVLTDRGWKRFDSVDGTEKVASYHLDTGGITFDTPDVFIKEFSPDIVHLKSDRFIDITCTPDHRFPVRNRKTGVISTSIAAALPPDKQILCAGQYTSGSPMRLSKIILLCAIQADGNYTPNGSIDWGFTKRRKYERLVDALTDEGIRFRDYSKAGRYRVYVPRSSLPLWMCDAKTFGSWILDLDAESLKLFCSEVFMWDGDYTRAKTYLSSDNTNLDWVQIAHILSGSRANIRPHASGHNVLNVSSRDNSMTTNTEISTLDGGQMVYCFTMPKDTMVVRKNGIPVITNNSQNFPKRGKWAKAFRSIFPAPDGWTYTQVDLSQAELRIAAWEANETTMIRLYNNGADIHAATAAATMGVSLDTFMAYSKDVRDMKRYQAKAVNFGFIYGMGASKFRQYAKTDYGLDLTEEESYLFREVFFDTYPKLQGWHERRREFVRKYGYVEALHGAIRHLPNIFSPDETIQGAAERQAINSTVQRFASDLGVMALTRLCRDAPREFIRPVAFIHDALVVAVKDEYLEEGMSAIKWYMETPPLKKWFGITSPVPILADVEYGKTLAELEEAKDVESVRPEWAQPDSVYPLHRNIYDPRVKLTA